jgi:hypothetical protein
VQGYHLSKDDVVSTYPRSYDLISLISTRAKSRYGASQRLFIDMTHQVSSWLRNECSPDSHHPHFVTHMFTSHEG